MKKFIIMILLASTKMSFAQSQFCEISRSRDFASNFIEQTDNQLSFRNQGGMLGMGVCWWHSRFTRNATFLANFVEGNKEIKIKKVLSDLRKGKKVVTIPGFTNLREFSETYADEIQSEIEKWQRIDGLVRQQWIVGLWGRQRLPEQKLRYRMEYLYDYMQEGNIAYLMLQLEGFSSHGWLVSKMERLDDGFRLTIIDSNYREPLTYHYRFGDTSFYKQGYGQFIPYLAKKKEMEKLKKARANFCS